MTPETRAPAHHVHRPVEPSRDRKAPPRVAEPCGGLFAVLDVQPRCLAGQQVPVGEPGPFAGARSAATSAAATHTSPTRSRRRAWGTLCRRCCGEVDDTSVYVLRTRLVQDAEVSRFSEMGGRLEPATLQEST